MASITLTEDHVRRFGQVLDELTDLKCIPYRPLNGAIVIVIASGIVTSVDIAQAVTTKTLSGTIDDSSGTDWTGP
jgi:hypothetical protein